MNMMISSAFHEVCLPLMNMMISSRGVFTSYEHDDITRGVFTSYEHDDIISISRVFPLMNMMISSAFHEVCFPLMNMMISSRGVFTSYEHDDIITRCVYLL